MSRPKTDKLAIAYLEEVRRKHGALPLPGALVKSGLYTNKSYCRQLYMRWLKEGILAKPDVLGGVYTPGPNWPKESSSS